MANPDSKPPDSRKDSILRRTTIRPGNERAQSTDSVYAANRLTTLVHELSNLLDGSMRCLRAAISTAETQSGCSSDAQVTVSERGDLLHRLSIVRTAMEQMAGLVRAVHMGTPWERLGEHGASLGVSGSLVDAIEHAAEVMRPVAEPLSIRIETSLSVDLGGLQCGPVFTLLTAALRNAIESIQKTGRTDGVVNIDAWVERAAGAATSNAVAPRGPGKRRPKSDAQTSPPTAVPASQRIIIEVTDNGAGPPKQPERAFEFGFTTKKGAPGKAAGIGLSLSSTIVHGLGGVIMLQPRSPATRGSSRRRTRAAGEPTAAPGGQTPVPAVTGAVLHIELPVSEDPSIGGLAA